MDRRSFLQRASLGAASAWCAGTARAKAAVSTTPPNIVVILCDDMGYSDIGCYGGEIQTPALDRLAAKGLRFRQFYNTARCCPSRASLLTGLYPHQAGLGNMVSETDRRGYEGYLTNRGVTTAEVLRERGYATRMVGKWHVTPMDRKTNQPGHREALPLQRGFDRFYGTVAGAGNYYYPNGLMRDNEVIEAEDPDHFYYTDAISDQAVTWIRECGAASKPLFMEVAYTAPHWPLHALEADIAKYADRYRAGWDALREERYARMNQLGVLAKPWRLSPRPDSVPAWKDAPDKEWEIRRMAVYAAMIDRMDQGIGRIVSALETHGVFDNTLLLFLADNGGCNEGMDVKGGSGATAVERGLARGWAMKGGNDPSVMPGPKETFQSYGGAWALASNTPFRKYKKWTHEGGISTPLIACWPDRLRNTGGFNDCVGHIIDIAPTCIEAGGGVYPEEFQGHKVLPQEGKSLVPVFDSGVRKGHDQIGWEHVGNRALREGDWKLVAEEDGPWELYDLSQDRTELDDLSSKDPKRAKKMMARWERWAKHTFVV